MQPPIERAGNGAGIVLALASAACFGTNIIGAQIAGAAGLSGPVLVFYRVLLVLVGIALLMLARRASFTIRSGERGALALFGCTTALVGCAYLSSVAFIPVSVAAVIFYTFPILIVLTEPLLTSARFSLGRIAVAFVAFAGVVLVIGTDLGGLDPRGLALAALASVTATVQFFAGASSARSPLLAKLFWTHVIVLPVTAFILALAGGLVPPSAFAAAPVAVVVTIAGYVVGFALQVLALGRAAPGPVGLAFCAEPVVAVAIAAALLGERIASAQYLGGALVIAAIVANIVMEQRRSLLRPGAQAAG